MGLHAAPALAVPSPRNEEWWFGAWEVTNKVWPLTRGDGVVVAVIDSGVQADVADLRGVVLKGADFDGPAAGDGRRDFDTEKGGHGTAMAALIAGQGSGTGMAGVAPESRILPIAAATDNFVRTIHYAVDHGARVINISSTARSAHCIDDVQQAVAYAVQHDVVVVASAGNEGNAMESGNSPANCAGVLAVGALSADLTTWEKSTPGDNVMVAAPGGLVGSIGKDGTFSSRNNGTSQAAALTSGVIALIRSRYPHMPGREVVQRLLATAKDIGPKGWDKKTGYGAIIPYLALTANVPPNASNPVYERFDHLNQSSIQISSSKVSPSGGGPRKTAQDSHLSRSNTRMLLIGLAFGALTAVAGGYCWLRRLRSDDGRS